MTISFSLPISCKRLYGNRLSCCKIDDFGIGESWKCIMAQEWKGECQGEQEAAHLGLARLIGKRVEILTIPLFAHYRSGPNAEL